MVIKLKINLVVGSHDYGQYYSDIYWKYIIRGVRRKNVLDKTISVYAKNFDDIEVQIAIAGLKKSIEFPATQKL